MLLLVMEFFFTSTPDYPKGQLNPDAWLPFAITGAILMIFSVLYSSISTRNESKNLSKWRGSISIYDIFNELKIALGNKSFIVFFFGNLFLSLAWGLSNSLTLFVNTYFWEFEASQIKYFLPVYLISTLLAFYFTPRLVKFLDKKNIVLLSIFGVAFFAPMPLLMFYLGYTPEKGTLSLVLFIACFLVFLITFNVIGNMTRDSMIGDIADQVELDSGKRQEGVLFATVSFMQKLNTGIGSFFAGQVLNYINFDRSNNTPEQAYTLAIIQGPVVTLLFMIPLIIFLFYRLTKERHTSILRKLDIKKL